MTAAESQPRIYLDNHATTRVDPRVVDCMLPWWSERYGNPASAGHAWGEEAREAVDQARTSLAAHLGGAPQSYVFTSGATESNNLAIRGVAEAPRQQRRHLVSVRTEHPSVLEPLQRLEREGWRVTLLDVAPHTAREAGQVDIDALESALTDETALVSIMLANNEIGVIQPIAEIAQRCHRRGIMVHCDATQAVGKIPVEVTQLGVDLMSFTAHKVYGPKGIGALWVRSGPPAVRLRPQILGGAQQAHRRAGTLNVPGVIGLARAVELAVTELPGESRRIGALRGRLWQRLAEGIPGIMLCGPSWEPSEGANDVRRLPGNLNVALGDVDGEAVRIALAHLAVSSGAACASGEPGPSHVLLALGLDETLARSTLRFGLGRFTTAEEVEIAGNWVVEAVRQLRLSFR
jgi:cysteine desulfurase